MAIFKVTWLFDLATGPGGGATIATETRLAGWSETLYRSASDIGPVNAAAIALAGYRANLLPQAAGIIGYRIGQVFPTKGPTGVVSQFWPGINANATDLPQASLLMRAPSATTGNVRHFTLRGIPDGQITFGEFTPDVQYASILNDYMRTGLVGWQFPAEDLTQPKTPIVGITNAGVLTYPSLPPPCAPGDTINIYSTFSNNTFTKLSRTVQVQSVLSVDPELQILNWKDGPCAGGEFRLRLQLYCIIDATLTNWVKAVTRKVGRPFNLFRGRATKRRTA